MLCTCSAPFQSKWPIKKSARLLPGFSLRNFKRYLRTVLNCMFCDQSLLMYILYISHVQLLIKPIYFTTTLVQEKIFYFFINPSVCFGSNFPFCRLSVFCVFRSFFPALCLLGLVVCSFLCVCVCARALARICVALKCRANTQ